MRRRFFTIGHSRRTLPEFVGILRKTEIELVVDVRHIPRSRANPQFNLDTLSSELLPLQIGYVHIPELGGLRSKQRERPTSINLFWENQSFRNYADYALTDRFREGMTKLCTLGHERRCAIMCAEAVWWRCHRRIIADYLIASGEMVFHIFGLDHIAEATLTSGAVPQRDGTIIYPAPITTLSA
jgi:uncharacterized protein (DUF488 family)